MHSVSAIIVAAGSATRMQGIDKQLLELNGVPAFMHSVLAFDRIDCVSDIVIAAKEESIPGMKAICAEYTVSKPVFFTTGGATRQESVLSAIRSCDPQTDFVAIHDGARPLVTPKDIHRVITDAFRCKAATLGVPSKDTVKILDDSHQILSTPKRETVYLIQTPQVFAKRLYLKSVQAAGKAGQNFTDDCQLIEAIGRRVYVTTGSYQNIKITTPEDRLIARALMQQERM